MVRIPGVCNGNPETTVLAHLNGGGMGMKKPDLLGAWCCSSCHDMIDGRTQPKCWSPFDIKLMHYEGVFRTIEALIKEGVVDG